MTKTVNKLTSRWNKAGGNFWRGVSARYLPFADVASTELPWARLLRLSMFQFSVGLCMALLIGTLNRVLIIELKVAAWVVAGMIALPILAAPFRALMGHRSDQYKSVLGWKRVPYIWLGTLMQFGGLAIMPFALILLSQATDGPRVLGQVASAAAFFLVGFGMQLTQTAGLALATDLAPAQKQPRVVAMMYVMLLVGMLISGFVFSTALSNFSNTRLVQVVQASALVCVALNLLASWKQEPRRLGLADPHEITKTFSQTWAALKKQTNAVRYLLAVIVGTSAFAMQDVILEAYGAEVLGLSVSSTSLLTAITAAGSVLAYIASAFWLGRHVNPHRMAAMGLLVGLPAFSLIIFAQALDSIFLFRLGACLIGVGSGIFAVSSLAAAMQLDTEYSRRAHASSSSGAARNHHGFALGIWGAAQVSAAGLAMAIGGGLRDFVGSLATSGALGSVLNTPATGYSFVYHIELVLIIVALVIVGPMATFNDDQVQKSPKKLGFTDLPT